MQYHRRDLVMIGGYIHVVISCTKSTLYSIQIAMSCYSPSLTIHHHNVGDINDTWSKKNLISSHSLSAAIFRTSLSQINSKEVTAEYNNIITNFINTNRV